MYLRRWTAMHYHNAMKYYRQTKHMPQQNSQLTFEPPPADYMKGYPVDIRGKNKLEQRLVMNLFQKYPETKYISLSYQEKGEQVQEHVVLKFLRKQVKFIDEGYSEQKAFELTEQLLHKEMQRRIDSQLVSKELATSNNARSYMSYYQQRAEYESRLRAKRAERDLALKLMAEADYKPDIDEEIGLQTLKSAKDEIFAKYEKTLVQIVPNQASKVNAQKKTNKEMFEEFVERTHNLFEAYYKTASIRDRLDGLSDTQIQNSIMESPKKIQKNVSQILKKLDKYGVFLNERGEAVTPVGTPRRIKEMLETSEFQTALMYRDINYEQKHKTHIDTVTKTLISLRQKYRQVREQNDVPVEQRKANEERIAGVIKQTTINVPNNATYKLFETQEERILRLEIKWWERKSDILEIQELQNRLAEQPNVELEENLRERRETLEKRMEDIVKKLRQVKFRVEQQHFQTTNKLLFKEHIEVARLRNNFLITSRALIDDAATYFQIPYEKRRITQNALENDDLITRMLTRVPLVGGTTQLGAGNPEEFITNDDFVLDKTEELQKKKIITQSSLNRMRERIKKQQEDEEEGFKEDINEEEGEEELVGVKGELSLLDAFMQKSKDYFKEEESKQQNERRQKEVTVSKNKNLRKKK